MKILIIQPWLRVGGAEMVSLRLAGDLQRLGHATKIAALFTETGDVPKGRPEVEYALPPRAIGRICSQNRLFFFMLGPIVLFLLVLVNSAGIDLLNPHNSPSHWIAALVGRLRGIPVLWTCNEPPAPIDTRDAFRVGIPDYLGWAIASSPLDLLAVRNIAHIQVLSLKAQHDVLRRYGRSSTIVRSGVDPEIFKVASAASAVEKYQLQDKYVMACVGKLHPQKNQVACLNSLREVLPFIPNAVLLLVGVGPQRRELEEGQDG